MYRNIITVPSVTASNDVFCMICSLIFIDSSQSGGNKLPRQLVWFIIDKIVHCCTGRVCCWQRDRSKKWCQSCQNSVLFQGYCHQNISLTAFSWQPLSVWDTNRSSSEVEEELRATNFKPQSKNPRLLLCRLLRCLSHLCIVGFRVPLLLSVCLITFILWWS